MSLILQGSTSGSCTLQEQAVAGTTVLTLPTTSGTVVVGSSAVSAAGQIPFSTDGSTYTPTAKIVSGTSVASTSGTSIDFTSIPSWVKRITVMFDGVSTNGTSNLQVQIGDSGGIENTGYTAAASGVANSGNLVTAASSTSGFPISSVGSAANALSGALVCSLQTGTTWVVNGSVSQTGGGFTGGFCFGGVKALSDTLTQLRITTINGTDTFDAGSINILYE